MTHSSVGSANIHLDAAKLSFVHPPSGTRGDIMERREFLKLGLGVVAGATALAASANAAPLPPIQQCRVLRPRVAMRQSPRSSPRARSIISNPSRFAGGTIGITTGIGGTGAGGAGTIVIGVVTGTAITGECALETDALARAGTAIRSLPFEPRPRRYSCSPNRAANRFSPWRVKLTTRLPGAASRAAHFSSVNRFNNAAPSVPAR